MRLVGPEQEQDGVTYSLWSSRWSPDYWMLRGRETKGSRMVEILFGPGWVGERIPMEALAVPTLRWPGFVRIATRKMLKEMGLEPESTRIVTLHLGNGCSMTAVVGGKVLEAVNLGWQGIPLREALEREFGCPVFVANDVDVGVYGEYRFGAAKSARCAVGVFPGTGIGGGCVYEGKIFRAKFCSAMEIGHIQVNPHGKLCGCGRYGCRETEASRLAIAAEVAASVRSALGIA